MAADLFSRLAGGRPPTEISAKQSQKIRHAQKVLDFILRWNRPTVRSRDLRIYGPRPRDRNSAHDSTTILIQCGWLSSVPSRRYDSREFRIMRKPVVCPTVASVAD
jgi:hypothetical protein